MDFANIKVLSMLLGKTKQKMDTGSCGLDDDEFEAVSRKFKESDCGLDDDTLRILSEKVGDPSFSFSASTLRVIGEGVIHRKLFIEQVCQKYGITRATLNRWQNKGKLPPFRKDSSSKDYLFEDEADRWVEDYERRHT